MGRGDGNSSPLIGVVYSSNRSFRIRLELGKGKEGVASEKRVWFIISA